MDKKYNKIIKENMDKEGIPDEEMPEWSAEEFRTAKRGLDGLASLVGEDAIASLRKVGRPKSVNPKKNGTFRLPADLWKSIKSSGSGYNARVEMVLREAIMHGKI